MWHPMQVMSREYIRRYRYTHSAFQYGTRSSDDPDRTTLGHTDMDGRSTETRRKRDLVGIADTEISLTQYMYPSARKMRTMVISIITADDGNDLRRSGRILH